MMLLMQPWNECTYIYGGTFINYRGMLYYVTADYSTIPLIANPLIPSSPFESLKSPLTRAVTYRKGIW